MMTQTALIGSSFILKGTTGPVFVVKEAYLMAGFIPTVRGENDAKRLATNPRIADVQFVAAA